jgi:hypothetical protein
MAEKRNANRILVMSEEKKPLEDLDACGSIILKWIFDRTEWYELD